MKRMLSKEEVEEIVNESELAERVNELAAVYTYEDLTLTEAQFSELTSTGSVQIDLSEDPDTLARLHNANVVTIYTAPEHTGKVIIAQRQTLTATKATFTSLDNDNSTLKQYAMDVNLVVEGEGGAVNIGLAEVGGGTKLYRHTVRIQSDQKTITGTIISTSNLRATTYEEMLNLSENAILNRLSASDSSANFIATLASLLHYYEDDEEIRLIRVMNVSTSALTNFTMSVANIEIISDTVAPL